MLRKFRIGGSEILGALLIALLAAFIAGCHDGSSAPSIETANSAHSELASPPAGLHYSNSAVVYVTGAEIVPNTPSSSGGPIEQYHVLPALPVGLAFHSATGAISGTPTAVSTATIYTVTGSNRAGAATARLQIEVKAAAIAPESLTYRNRAAIYTKGVEIEPNVPDTSGGEITSFSVSPALPAGLSLDPRTGVISGVPAALSAAATYTVTGSNSAGSVQTELSIEIQKQIVPPSGLAYSDPEPVYVVGQPIAPNEPQSTGGEITQYSISPALPRGLELNTLTGVISGTAAAAQSKTPYTITGNNSAGSVTAQMAITVKPAPAEWVPGGNMAQARYQHTATLLDSGKVLVVGGRTVVEAELYDPATKQWSRAGNTLHKGFGHTAVRLKDGKVLVAGGGKVPVSAELYDPATNHWWTAGSMMQNRYLHAAALLPDGNVLVVGGYDYGMPYLDSAERYDPVTNRWSSAGHLEHGRGGPTATCLKDGRVLVVGGRDKSGPLSSAELYDPTTNHWRSAGRMAHERLSHAAVLLRDGRVLVIGGSDRSGTLGSAELYDPATNQWSSAGSMAQNRDSPAVALLPNGKVLVVGGYRRTELGHVAVNSAELYDPATNQWSPTSSMTASRVYATATSLPDGKVIVVGGSRELQALSSTELFRP